MQTTATQLTRRRARTNGSCTSTALSVQGAHAAVHCVRDSRRRRRNVARSLDDGPQPGAHDSMPPCRDRTQYPLRSYDSPPCADAERVRKRKARRRATIPMLLGEHERPGKLCGVAAPIPHKPGACRMCRAGPTLTAREMCDRHEGGRRHAAMRVWARSPPRILLRAFAVESVGLKWGCGTCLELHEETFKSTIGHPE